MGGAIELRGEGAQSNYTPSYGGHVDQRFWAAT